MKTPVDMTCTRTWKRLQELAEKPYDLTAPEALEQGGRLEQYVGSSKLLRLFFATERVDSEVLLCLQRLADELFLVGQFKEMRRGKVINRIEGVESENRQVLHTATRDLFSSSPLEPGATSQARHELAKLNDFLDELDDGRLLNHQ